MSTMSVHLHARRFSHFLCKAKMQTICLALDIETTGCKPLTHAICSIGWCVGTLPSPDSDPPSDAAFFGRVLKKGHVNIEVQWPTVVMDGSQILNYGDFEPRCWREFWADRPELQEFIKQNAVPAQEAMRQFSAMLSELETEFPEDRFKIKVLSDNPSFDIGRLDTYLDRYVQRVPVRYSATTNRYRPVDAPDDMLSVFPKDLVKHLMDKHINSVVQHDHNPANDAEHIYRQYVLAQRLKRTVGVMFAQQSVVSLAK